MIIYIRSYIDVNESYHEIYNFQRLREKLDALLEYKITHPGNVNWNSEEGRILE